MRGKIPFGENVQYELLDKNGNKKLIYQHNWLGKLLMKFGIDMKGFLFGYKKYSMNISNLITTKGKESVADLLGDVNTISAFDYIAVGTGTTAAAVTDTTLETEITDSGMARAQGTNTLVTTDTTNDTLQCVKQFTVTGAKAVTESGVLNAASAGSLLARQVFSAINVTNGDTLQITWKFDVD